VRKGRTLGQSCCSCAREIHALPDMWRAVVEDKHLRSHEEGDVVAVDGSQVRRDACADSFLVYLCLLQPYEVSGFRRLYTPVLQRNCCCRYMLGSLPVCLLPIVCWQVHIDINDAGGVMKSRKHTNMKQDMGRRLHLRAERVTPRQRLHARWREWLRVAAASPGARRHEPAAWKSAHTAAAPACLRCCRTACTEQAAL